MRRMGGWIAMPPSLKRRAAALAFPLSLALFTIVFVRNAWVVDDAYITFRTVDNFVAGHGLVWNLGERVQAYSHPLWMFLLSLPRLLGADLFYASIALSYLFCLGTLLVATRVAQRRNEWWRPVAVVACFASSKAVMDYSSSGLENPLSYFLAALFVAEYWRRPQDLALEQQRVLRCALIASLAALNRLDTLLLYLPALSVLVLQRGGRNLRKTGRDLVLGGLPLLLWLGFAAFYYGSVFPNTAVAKLMATGVPLGEKLQRGFEYLANSLIWDPMTHLVVVSAIVAAWRQRSRPALWMLAGVLAYYLYVVASAASATHMSGRFFALPCVFAIVIGGRLLPDMRSGMVVAAVAVLALAVNPHSPLRMGTSWYADSEQDPDHIDTNLFVHREGAALVDWFDGRELPDHDWFHAGLAFRDRPERVSVGADGGAAIGYFAYAAGPSKFVVDYAALTDPLLARLPACNTTPAGSWRSGHFFRSIPPGYLESLESGENRIEDPGLRAYYQEIRSITRGPLFSWGRLADVIELDLGLHESLKDEYLESSKARCRIPVRRPPR